MPINDLGIGIYQGFQGGLYPNGSNVRPDSYAPPSISPVNGVIGFASIGLSNTNYEFAGWISNLVQNPSGHNPAIRLCNGALSGASLHDWNTTPWVWASFASHLKGSGIAPDQLQVIWMGELTYRSADPEIAGKSFPDDAMAEQNGLEQLISMLMGKYPSVKRIYLGGRIYAGYAGGRGLNPEPLAYDNGWACKWTVENHINNPGVWVGWGPYLWADGVIPRSDGLTWACSDFQADGTHPSKSGIQKVVNMLNEFFMNDPDTIGWFRHP